MRLLIFSIAFIFSFSSFAQLKEAYLKYDIQMEAMDSSVQTKKMVDTLKNSTMELYFAPNKARMDINMGGFSMTSVIVDRGKEVLLVISDAGKMAMLGKPENPSQEKDPSIKITALNEHKTILGYSCSKYIIVEEGVANEYWLTNDNIIDSKDKNIVNGNLPGFPIVFTKTTDDNVKETYQLTTVKDHLDAPLRTIFSLAIPEGFTVFNGQ